MVAKYITLLDRASKVTFGIGWKELSTFYDKVYIKKAVDRLLNNDVFWLSKYKRYILKGGRFPKPMK